MAAPSEPDIATLQADIQQLRADFAKMATTMRDVAGSGIVKVGDKAQASAEKGERLLDHGARAFCELLAEVDNFDVKRLLGGPDASRK